MRSRRAGSLAITIALIVIGAALVAYPFVSNYLYENGQQEVIYSYQQEMEEIGATDSDALSVARSDAEDYNEVLASGSVQITDPFDPDAVPAEGVLSYNDLLDLSGNGIMCFLEIPCINVDLPVYHGTSEHVLREGVGHLENTSLPIGGESTHTVLSAHTGLVDKKLFTDLTLMEIGDLFYIHVLGETHAYEVDQILVVEPTDLDALTIEQGEDLVTLVTCTPYGINSHRLLVRGHRVPYDPEEAEQVEQHTGSVWMQQYLSAICVGFGVLVAVLVVASVVRRSRERAVEGGGPREGAHFR